MKGKKEEHEKPLLVLRPHIFNAILPMFMRNLIYSIIINFGLFGILYITEYVGYMTGTMQYGILVFYLLFIISTAFMAMMPLLWRIVFLLNTTYIFYKKHLVKEFEFIVIRTSSVSYDHIVDITISISLWDRICKSGDMTLHTAENRAPDIKLMYVSKPEKIEHLIYDIISRGSRNYESRVHEKARMHPANSMHGHKDSHTGNIPEHKSSRKNGILRKSK
ncbi:MAG: PH domain-containing protein [Candidatus Aenigmarchaeota archaeon]|nr:PH domain-containing protein [Candidatus Aenigmarchaeota archaeon]